jgi:hypothetical protein
VLQLQRLLQIPRIQGRYLQQLRLIGCVANHGAQLEFGFQCEACGDSFML